MVAGYAIRACDDIRVSTVSKPSGFRVPGPSFLVPLIGAMWSLIAGT